MTLGRGVIDTAGRRHREAVLAAPDGWLEAAVLELVDPRPAARVDPPARHRLLADALERLGGYAEPDTAVVAALSRGDLDLLGFALRRELLGSALALVLRCSNPACGEEADVDLTVDELLPDTTEAEPEWFVAEAGAHGRVLLHAVTGADDAAVAAAGGSPDERTAALLARLVRGADGEEDAPMDAAGWLALPVALRHAALLALAERPTAPTTDLQIGCPSCGAILEVRLDPLVVLARELGSGGERLLVETHCLAFHYGWSEEAILALPRARRWRYLSLLRDQLLGAPLDAGPTGG